MSSVTPPPPPILPETGLQLPPLAVINTPPAALVEIAQSGRFDALILSLTGNGKVSIETVAGKAQLNTPLALPKSGTLQLQLIAQQGSIFKFAIVAINGKAPPGVFKLINSNASPSTNASADKSKTIQGAAQPVTLKTTPTTGAQVIAVFTRGLNPPNSPLSVQNQTQKINATTAKASAAQPIQTKSSAINSVTKTTTQTVKPIQPGSQLTVKITNIAAPSLSKPQAIQLSNNPQLGVGQRITAQVTGQNVSGAPTLSTSAGTITLPTSAALPVGSTLTLEIIKPLLLPQIIETGAAAQLQKPFTNGSWPVLAQAFDELDLIAPTAADQIVNAIPKPGAQFASKILFFISALKGGDLSAWIGDAPVRILVQSKPNQHSVIDKLKDDFSKLAQTKRQPMGGEWREWTVPVINQNEIDPIRFYTRPDTPEDDEDDADANQTRFIIDLNLSNLGRFQLDGFVNTDRKKFDLIIKSDVKLPLQMMTQMQSIFSDANALSGSLGGLSFQAKPADFTDFIGDHAGKFIV